MTPAECFCVIEWLKTTEQDAKMLHDITLKDSEHLDGILLPEKSAQGNKEGLVLVTHGDVKRDKVSGGNGRHYPCSARAAG